MPILESIVNSGRDYVSNTANNVRDTLSSYGNTVQNFAGDPVGFIKGALANGATESLFDVLGLAGNGYGPEGYQVHVSSPDQSIYVRAFLPEEFSYGVSGEYESPFAEGIDVGTGSGLFGFTGLGSTGDKFDNSYQGLARLARGGRRASSQLMTMQVWQGTSHINFSMPLIFVFESDSYKDCAEPCAQLQKLVLPRRGNQAGEIISPGPKLQLREGAGREAGGVVGQGYVDASIEFATEDIVEFGQGVRNLATAAVSPGPQDDRGLVERVAGAGGETLIQLNEAALQRELVATGVIDTYLGLFEQKDRIQVEIGNFLYFDSVVITEVDVTNQIRLDRFQGKPIMAEANVSFETFLMPFAEDIDTIVRR